MGSVGAPQGFSLRPAEEGDTEFAFLVRRAALRDDQSGWDEEAEWRRHYDRFSRLDFRIAEWEGERVASMATTFGEQVVQLHQLFVAPTFQGRGIGSLCLRSVLKEANGRSVTLRVLRANSRARTFYEWHGFRTVGETKAHYELQWDP